MESIEYYSRSSSDSQKLPCRQASSRQCAFVSNSQAKHCSSPTSTLLVQITESPFLSLRFRIILQFTRTVSLVLVSGSSLFVQPTVVVRVHYGNLKLKIQNSRTYLSAKDLNASPTTVSFTAPCRREMNSAMRLSAETGSGFQPGSSVL